MLRRSIDGLDTLKAELEQVTSIPISSQILMTSFGMQLEFKMMAEALTAVGKDEYIIFVFDRELLDASNVKNTSYLNEKPILETPVIASAAVRVGLRPIKNRTSWRNFNLSEECISIVRVFEAHYSQGQSYVKFAGIHADICERFFQEQKVQLRALGVALTNLESHTRSIVNAHEEFQGFAETEIAKNNRLVNSLPEDLAILRRITIHPEILKASNIVSRNNEPITLANFVTEGQPLNIAKEEQEAFEKIIERISALQESVQSVQFGTEALQKKKFDGHFPANEKKMLRVRELLESIKRYNEKLERDLGRVQNKVNDLLDHHSPSGYDKAIETIEAFEHLADIHTKDYIPAMEKSDQYIRDQVNMFTHWKNTMTATLISSLQQISLLESSIASIPDTLSVLNSEIRSLNQDYKRLAQVQQLPFAYGMTILEIVRRQEYTKLLVQKSHTLAEIMSHFRDLERKRRDVYRTEVKKVLQLNVPALDDNPPICEISTPNLRDDRLPQFSKEDIQEFADLITQIRPSSTQQTPSFFTRSIRHQTSDDHYAALQNALLKSSDQLEGMNVEFMRIIEKRFFSEKGINFISHTSSVYDSRSPNVLSPPTQLGRRSKRLSRQSFSEDGVSGGNTNTDLLLLEKNKQLENTEAKIKAYEARIRSLENTLQSNYQASKNSEDLPPKLDPSATKMLANTDQELANMKKKYQDLQSAHNNLKGEKVALEERVNDIEAHYREIETKYVDLISDNENLVKKIEDLKARDHETETAHTELSGEREYLRIQLDEIETHYNSQKHDYDNVLKENEVLKKRASDMEERFQDLEFSLTEASKKNQILEKSYLDAVRENETLEQRYKDLGDKNESIEQHCQYLETLIPELKGTNEEHEKKLAEVNSLAAENQDLQISLKNLSEKYERSVQENHQTQEKYNYDTKTLRIRTEALKSERLAAIQLRETMEKDLEDRDKELQDTKKKLKQKSEELTKMSQIHQAAAENAKVNYAHMERERENLKMKIANREEALDDARKKHAQLIEKVNLSKRIYAEKEVSLEKAQKLVKDLTDSITEYLEILDPSAPTSEEVDPLNMVQKLGSLTTRIEEDLQDKRRSLKDSQTSCQNLNDLNSKLQNQVAERTMLAGSLSNKLWNYYDHIRSLMSAMQVAIPVVSEKKSLESPVNNDEVKSSEGTMSDSYLAEDLNQFFAKMRETDDDWPKERYLTLINLASKVDLEQVRELVRRSPKDAENLARKHQKEYKASQEKYKRACWESKNKLAFQNFKIGDLAMFLPTRNTTSKIWAAFNIKSPHYFLNPNDSINSQLRSRDWIVMRIVDIRECIADSADPASNPFDLPKGVKFYLLDVENWENSSSHVQSRRRSDSISSMKSEGICNTRGIGNEMKPMSASLSHLPQKNEGISPNADSPLKSRPSRSKISKHSQGPLNSPSTTFIDSAASSPRLISTNRSINDSSLIPPSLTPNYFSSQITTSPVDKTTEDDKEFPTS
ncbi:hypothetical protein G9A89_019625 [Geosiphon pyriformis]|nr:hypothetical protein G9A89_019625 [Geosiphon pyriformis]